MTCNYKKINLAMLSKANRSWLLKGDYSWWHFIRAARYCQNKISSRTGSMVVLCGLQLVYFVVKIVVSKGSTKKTTNNSEETRSQPSEILPWETSHYQMVAIGHNISCCPFVSLSSSHYFFRQFWMQTTPGG